MLFRSLALVCLLITLSWDSLSQVLPSVPAQDATASEAESLCTLKTEEDGVKAYTCENEDSKFRMVKLVFQADTTPELLVAMLRNIEGYNNWQYKTINAAVLEPISDSELIYYAEFVSPWPFDNRDVIVHMRVERTDSSSLKIFYKGMPDFIPEKRGITRVVSSASSMDVVTIAPGKIHVEFRSNVDPGGSLPAFLMNQFAVDGPFESFSELRRQLNQAGTEPVAGRR